MKDNVMVETELGNFTVMQPQHTTLMFKFIVVGYFHNSE